MVAALIWDVVSVYTCDNDIFQAPCCNCFSHFGWFLRIRWRRCPRCLYSTKPVPSLSFLSLSLISPYRSCCWSGDLQSSIKVMKLREPIRSSSWPWPHPIAHFQSVWTFIMYLTILIYLLNVVVLLCSTNHKITDNT